MADSTHDTSRIMDGARTSLAVNRTGGYHRGSIGAGSARLKKEHAAAKLKRIFIAIATIVVAAMGFGLFVSALGFEGLFITVLLAVVAVWVLSRYPKIKAPKAATLSRGDLQQNVAKTELWLEHQRPALPAPAVTLVDQIGVQLDGLGVQLQGLDENTPAAVSVRNLVTRDLPEVVSSYTKIPRHLRSQESAGSTPDSQVTESLKSISREIDTVTRQLAEGDLDALAVRTRYLDYKYGSAMDETPALPPPGAPDPALPPVSPAPKALGETDSLTPEYSPKEN
ncbi:hypothetical protein [Croceicoccus pelagius]|uniref:5-bromo-4-chloroindolyl phosphate hydrolysis protein n=1 Tax=Croceicoccus pelagius TaxID=1703341 RepID=A0A916YLP3_9SPHN|nr:hypothetical protein [Croceicoccus pelagius]GGD49704.1 hypothetical protein GCM10010989_25000 [Croceicoccus pelagius]